MAVRLGVYRENLLAQHGCQKREPRSNTSFSISRNKRHNKHPLQPNKLLKSESCFDLEEIMVNVVV